LPVTAEREWMREARRGKVVVVVAPQIFFARKSSVTLPAILVGAAVVVCSVHARAQCTADVECKGDRICEGGKCVDPPPAPPPVTTALAPEAADVPATGAPVGAATASLPQQPSAPPRFVHHSAVMLRVGIVSAALAAVAGVVAVGTYFKGGCGCGWGNIGSVGPGTRDDSNDRSALNALLTAVVLGGVGVPLIIVGAHREPAPRQSSATLSPWIGRQTAGLSLQLEL
jgi:hypothetical protein